MSIELIVTIASAFATLGISFSGFTLKTLLGIQRELAQLSERIARIEATYVSQDDTKFRRFK